MNMKLLRIYLHDHMAGAVGAVELGQRMVDSHAYDTFGPRLRGILGEIVEDRARLGALMDALGIERSRSKEAASWLAEKAARLKLNGQIVGDSPLSCLVEIEGLLLGVAGKRALWQSLRAVGANHPGSGLADFDLDELEERANAQLRALEEVHGDAARIALGSAGA